VPSIDYMTLGAVRRSARLDYARIRLAGSIAFLLANLAGGAALGAFGERLAVPLLLTALALIAATVAWTTTIATPPAEQARTDAPRPRLPPVLWLAIAAAAAIQASHAAIYAFGSIHWSRHGIPSAWIGTLWAIGVAAEIVLFAGIGRCPARWRTPFRLLALGGGAALIRAIGMALVGDRLGPVIALQVLHGLSFGATQLGAMAAVSRYAPDGARGRAQGTVSATNALASASATLVCGAAYQAGGGPLTFALMAPLALLGLCLAARAARIAPPSAFTPPQFSVSPSASPCDPDIVR
jgi:PPP family 3-phenylpropionic acid transporter